MSYLNQAYDPRRRATAMVTVGAVHALLAVALVTGLTVQFTDIVRKPFGATNIPLPPPPPEPTPPKPSTPRDTTLEVPRPPIPLPPPPAPGPVAKWEEFPGPTGGESTGPILPPLPPPPPSPSFAPKSARPSNSSAGWISTNDYPRSPLMNEIEGTAGYLLVIGTNGRVASCDLTRSSGNRALDDATCRLITNRARFEPATDESGAKVLGTYTGSVRWEIPN
jgi:protein TonB